VVFIIYGIIAISVLFFILVFVIQHYKRKHEQNKLKKLDIQQHALEKSEPIYTISSNIPKEMPIVGKCKFCGVEREKDSRFCRYCGSKY